MWSGRMNCLPPDSHSAHDQHHLCRTQTVGTRIWINQNERIFSQDHSYNSTHQRNITGFVNGLNQNHSNYCLRDKQKKNCYSVGYIRYDSFNLGHHSTSS